MKRATAATKGAHSKVTRVNEDVCENTSVGDFNEAAVHVVHSGHNDNNFYKQ